MDLASLSRRFGDFFANMTNATDKPILLTETNATDKPILLTEYGVDAFHDESPSAEERAFGATLLLLVLALAGVYFHRKHSKGMRPTEDFGSISRRWIQLQLQGHPHGQLTEAADSCIHSHCETACNSRRPVSAPSIECSCTSCSTASAP